MLISVFLFIVSKTIEAAESGRLIDGASVLPFHIVFHRPYATGGVNSGEHNLRLMDMVNGDRVLQAMGYSRYKCGDIGTCGCRS